MRARPQICKMSESATRPLSFSRSDIFDRTTLLADNLVARTVRCARINKRLNLISSWHTNGDWVGRESEDGGRNKLNSTTIAKCIPGPRCVNVPADHLPANTENGRNIIVRVHLSKFFIKRGVLIKNARTVESRCNSARLDCIICYTILKNPDYPLSFRTFPSP